MQFVLLGAWLGAAAIIGIGYLLNGRLSVGMCVCGLAVFAGWVVLVLAGKRQVGPNV